MSSAASSTNGLVVTWPGGIGNPSNMRIPTSGGRRRRIMYRSATRKNRRATRKSCRTTRKSCRTTRKSRRNTRKANRRRA